MLASIKETRDLDGEFLGKAMDSREGYLIHTYRIPMATAFLTFGGSLTRNTWLAGGCCVRKSSCAICLMIDGLSFIRYVLRKDGKSKFCAEDLLEVEEPDFGGAVLVDVSEWGVPGLDSDSSLSID